MKKDEILAALEAVLFSSGEPMSIDRLSQIFEIKPEKTEKLLDELAQRLDERNSGLKLVRLENTRQLATRNEHAEYIKKAFDIRRKTPLSPLSPPDLSFYPAGVGPDSVSAFLCAQDVPP